MCVMREARIFQFSLTRLASITLVSSSMAACDHVAKHSIRVSFSAVQSFVGVLQDRCMIALIISCLEDILVSFSPVYPASLYSFEEITIDNSILVDDWLH